MFPATKEEAEDHSWQGKKEDNYHRWFSHVINFLY